MTLKLHFWALDPAEAGRKAQDWMVAEPNVESGTVVEVTAVDPIRAAIPGHEDRYHVTVNLVMRSDYVQEGLGLSV